MEDKYQQTLITEEDDNILKSSSPKIKSDLSSLGANVTVV